MDHMKRYDFQTRIRFYESDGAERRKNDLTFKFLNFRKFSITLAQDPKQVLFLICNCVSKVTPASNSNMFRARRGAKSMQLIIPAKHPNNKLWKFDVTLGCEAGTRIPALTACHVAKVPPQLFGPETQI